MFNHEQGKSMQELIFIKGLYICFWILGVYIQWQNLNSHSFKTDNDSNCKITITHNPTNKF